MEARRKMLRQQLRQLEKHLRESRDRGEKTQTWETQLQELTEALAGATTSDKLDALSSAIARLEREVN